MEKRKEMKRRAHTSSFEIFHEAATNKNQIKTLISAFIAPAAVRMHFLSCYHRINESVWAI